LAIPVLLIFIGEKVIFVSFIAGLDFLCAGEQEDSVQRCAKKIDHISIELLVERRAIEARQAIAKGGHFAGEACIAGRQKIVVSCVRYNVIFRRIGQAGAHRFFIVGVRLMTVIGGTPQLDWDTYAA
jgi:hypothetical protein